MKSFVRFEYVPRKMSAFVSFLLFGLITKLRNFGLESHWNTLIFFDKKYMTSDLNMPHGQMSDFFSFPLFGLALVIKLRNFHLESHWNTLIFFLLKKKLVRFDYVLSNSVWFYLSLVLWVKLLAVSWEIRVLNFIEIV